MLNKYSLNLKKQNKKIVLAHGTFDVLHLGHIKHLNMEKNMVIN